MLDVVNISFGTMENYLSNAFPFIFSNSCDTLSSLAFASVSSEMFLEIPHISFDYFFSFNGKTYL